MKKIIIFSGAGISADSGLKTFRDNNGLWENYNIRDVATPEAWERNPKEVLDFYNLRRKQVLNAEPNNAHKHILRLEEKFKVQIITQNIDDLHERAGSLKVLHLHGEILNSRSTVDNSHYKINGSELNIGEFCKNNKQLRPDVVWFGEEVPMLPKAQALSEQADIFIVIGTSLNVYPAASLIFCVPEEAEKFLIDPKDVRVTDIKNLKFIREQAGTRVRKIVDLSLNPKKWNDKKKSDTF